MTVNEAIVVLQKIKPIPHRGDSKSTTHILETIALDMAIKALEQQPCEDCISREATIDAIYKKYIGGKDAIKNAPINDLYAEGLADAVDAVWDMPSVTPKAEQKAILDKIRAEMEQIPDTMGVSYNQYVSKIDVLQIIDKYKAEE